MTAPKPRRSSPTWVRIEPAPDYQVWRAPAFDGTQPCATTDPEVWFGDPRIARRMCAGCPFKDPCLEYALPRKWLHGVWGGMNRDQRNRLRREREIEIIPPDWYEGG